MAEEEKTREEVKEAETKEEVKEAETEEEGEEGDEGLPFPRATIVNMMRLYMDDGKQIKAQVKVEMNKWLGKMVERVTKKMNDLPYSYVDYAMFKSAIDSYERIQDIEEERKRIMVALEKIKADCDSMQRDVERKFVL